jgi:hypothetical protein
MFTHSYIHTYIQEYEGSGHSNNVDTILSLEESKLARAIEIHFAYMTPYLSSWPSGVAVLADPRYATGFFSFISQLCALKCMYVRMYTAKTLCMYVCVCMYVCMYV